MHIMSGKADSRQLRLRYAANIALSDRLESIECWACYVSF